MEKVYNIKDNITKNDDEYFKYELNGKFMVDDDGWFEGYLKNTYSRNSLLQSPEEYIFIFGIYHPNGILDLYSYNKYDNRPTVFKGEFKNSEYVGVIKYLYSQREDFTDHLNISESNSNPEDINEILTLIKTVFDLKKLSIVDNRIFLDFYNKVYENRIALNDILVKANEEITFTEEDRMTARHLNNEKREARHAVKVYLKNKRGFNL